MVSIPLGSDINNYTNQNYYVKEKDHIIWYGLLALPVGLEPTTIRLTAECSTCWAMGDYSLYSMHEYLIYITIKTKYIKF